MYALRGDECWGAGNVLYLDLGSVVTQVYAGVKIHQDACTSCMQALSQLNKVYQACLFFCSSVFVRVCVLNVGPKTNSSSIVA